MKCPNCQFENLDSAKFCGRCGAPLHAPHNPPRQQDYQQQNSQQQNFQLQNFQQQNSQQQNSQPQNFQQQNSQHETIYHEPYDSPRTASPRKRNTLILILSGILAGTIVIALGLFVGYLFFANPKREETAPVQADSSSISEESLECESESIEQASVSEIEEMSAEETVPEKSSMAISILDSSTNQTIADATVLITLPDGTTETASFQNDAYYLDCMPGNYRIHVEVEGYQAQDGMISDFPNTDSLVFSMKSENYIGKYVAQMEGTYHILQVYSQDGNQITLDYNLENLRTANGTARLTETVENGRCEFSAGIEGGHGANGQQSHFIIEFQDENTVILTKDSTVMEMHRE